MFCCGIGSTIDKCLLYIYLLKLNSMKKVLLAMAAVCCFSVSNAQTVTLAVDQATGIDGTLVDETKKPDGSVQAAKHYQPLNSLSIDGYSFSFTQGSSKTAPAYYYPTSTSTNGKVSIRIYNGNSITMTAPAGVTFSKVTATPDNSSTEATLYSGESTNTFSFTASATTRINSLTIDLGEGGSTGGSTSEDLVLLSADDANAAEGWTFESANLPEGLSYVWKWKDYNSKYYLNGSAYVGGTNYEVESWAISPAVTLASDAKTVNFEHAAKFQTTLTTLCGMGIREKGSTTWTNLTIPTWPTAGNWNFANSGDIDVSAFAGKEVEFGFKYGSSTQGADTWEIRNLVVPGNKAGGDTPTPTVKEVNSIAEALALESGTVVKVNFPMTVTFVNNKNIWTIDDEGAAINIYGENTYAVNDVIPAGWEGTFTVRYDVPQFTPSAALPAADGTSQFTPASVSNGVVNNSMVNQVLVIKDVNFAEATPAAKENFTGTSNGNTLNFRNNYTLPSVAAGDYDVKVVVNLYNGEPSLYVIEYLVKSAVEEIGVENGAAVYYDLNGRKVAGNLDKGIYVKVVNGKASKVVVK